MPSLKMLFLKHPVSIDKLAQEIVIPPKEEDTQKTIDEVPGPTKDDYYLKTLQD